MFIQLEPNRYVSIYEIKQIQDCPDSDTISLWIGNNDLADELRGLDRQRVLKFISLYCPNQEPRP